MYIQTETVNFRSIAVALIVVLWCYWLWNRRKYYAFALKYPGKFGLPVFGVALYIGHLDYVLKYFGSMLEECQQHVICAWLGIKPFLLVADAELAEQILNSPDCIEKGWPLYEPLDHGFRGSILTAPVHKWRPYRKSISVVFKNKTLLSFFPIFNVVKNNLIIDFGKFADQGGEHFVLQTILKNILVLSMETNLHKKLDRHEEIVSSYVEKFLSLLKNVAWQIGTSGLYFHKVLERFSNFHSNIQYLYDVIEEGAAEQFSKKNNTKDTDNIMNEDEPVILIDQIYKLYVEGKLSWDDVLKESLTMFIASLETTSNTIYSTIVFLAMYPDVQMRVYNEIATHFTEKDCDIEHKDFEHLPYLEMVVQETLRLAPAFPLIARQTGKPFRLPNGATVPENFQIMVSLYHLHRNKDLWGPNAGKYDPDNFLPEKIASRHPSAFMPFSKGARNCIGYRYAQLVLKVVLIALIQNFRFETDSKYEDFDIKFNVSSAFVEHPPLRIIRRS